MGSLDKICASGLHFIVHSSFVILCVLSDDFQDHIVCVLQTDKPTFLFLFQRISY